MLIRYVKSVHQKYTITTYFALSSLVLDRTTSTNMDRVFLHQNKPIRRLAGLEFQNSCRSGFQNSK